MSEALIGFNFHFLLFAMAFVGAFVAYVLKPSEFADEIWAPIFASVILWGFLEFIYWTARYLYFSF